MLSGKLQVKKETRVDKISNRKVTGRLKSTECTTRGRVKHTRGAAQASSPCVHQSRRATNPSTVRERETDGVTHLCFIPVLDKNGKALMPCHPARAREFLKRCRATALHLKGFFYVKVDIENGSKQDICVGIDSGSKREAFTVKSESHTYLNVLTDAVTWVKDAVEVKRNMRRARRFRKTPCRKNKFNRSKKPFPPSTKARWQWKLRIVGFLSKMYPITDFVVEDIAATTKKNCKKWNKSFSPLEVGKAWFYDELSKLGKLETKQGHETAFERDKLGLEKSKSKMKEVFSAHNVDSWVLANSLVGGHSKPENESLVKIEPLQFSRRQLHRLQASEGGERKRYGGTKTGKFTRGMRVRHKRYGFCYVGGWMEGVGISLHNLKDGKRVCQNGKEKDLEVMCYSSWRAA